LSAVAVLNTVLETVYVGGAQYLYSCVCGIFKI